MASYDTMPNRNPRATTILLLLLVVGYVLPGLCVPVPPTSMTAQHGPDMPCGSCHGHDKHTRIPTHNCCYATPQAPAATQAVCPQGPSLSVTNRRLSVSDSAHPRAGFGAIAEASEFSPPPVSVLRI